MTAPSTSIDPVASVETIRSHFPALDRTHNGKPVAYFDGPGGTQVPRSVVEAVGDYLLNHNANTHWAYQTSHETDAIIAEARRALADYVNGAEDEIVFGANMTTLTFHLGRALGRRWSEGDAIVVTELDHRANSDTWRQLAKERSLEVRVAAMTPDGQLDHEDLLDKIDDTTRLVAIGAASNAIGTMTDVRRVVDHAHTAGALVFVDAVHYAAHSAPDVVAWDCDFVGLSPYKFYGPHIGVLWGRRELLDDLDAPRIDPAGSRAPELLETGTLNHEGIAGARAAVDFLASLTSLDGTRREKLEHVSAAFHERGKDLVTRMWEGLSAIEGVTLHGLPPGGKRTATVGFSVDGIPSERVAEALADEAVFVSHGDFYAVDVIRRLGHEQDGIVRAGCAIYTTAEEVDRLITAIDHLRS